jgi:hypothetical protein
MNTMRRPKFIIGFAVAVVILMTLSFGLTSYHHSQVYSGKIVLQVAPTGSNITINGARVKPGTVGVVPGKNVISVSKTGFSSQTKTVTVAKDQPLNITIALVSNSPSTQNWYSTNQADEATLEQSTGQQYNQDSNQAVQQVPIIQMLPYVSPSLAYRIDYGEPLAGTTGQGIYITAPNAADQQLALQWIRDQGYDPSTLHIQYTTGPVNN